MHTEFSKDSQATKGEKQSIETRLQCLKFSRNLKEEDLRLSANWKKVSDSSHYELSGKNNKTRSALFGLAEVKCMPLGMFTGYTFYLRSAQ